MVYGTSIHAALEVYFRQRMLKQPVGIKALIDVLHDSWSHNGFVSLRHEEERMAAAEQTLRRLWKEFEAEDLAIIDVERAFQVELDEFKLRIRGRYDLILAEGDGVEIRDFKTSAVTDQRVAANRVRDSVPMQIYALAWGLEHEAPVKHIALHFVDSGVLAKRDKLNHVRTRTQIKEVVEGIRAEQYPRKGILTNLEMEGLA